MAHPQKLRKLDPSKTYRSTVVLQVYKQHGTHASPLLITLYEILRIGYAYYNISMKTYINLGACHMLVPLISTCMQYTFQVTRMGLEHIT
jgi:hypothetical protein